MTGDKLLNIVGGIVTIALVTTVVARPNSVKVIRAIGDSFSNAVSSALGKGVKFS